MRYFMPIFFIVVAVAGFFFYTNPQYQALKDRIIVRDQLVEANKKAADLRAVRQKLVDDRNQMAQSDIDKIQKMLPDSVENVGLIIDIDNLAKKYGMRIKDTRISDSVARSTVATIGPDSKKYGAITLSFSVSTSYENFQAFLKELENSARLVDVTSLTFAAGDKDDYDFNITIQTYWLK